MVTNVSFKKVLVIILSFMNSSFVLHAMLPRMIAKQSHAQKSRIQKRSSMKLLYAPWRSNYGEGSGKHALTKKVDTTSLECALCAMQKVERTTTILRRFTYNVVALNEYPYQKGHLMVLPHAHINTLDKASPESRAEAMELLAASSAILTKVLKADAINIGINLGKAAGAGIPSHLHWHIIPRWHGDISFLPIISNTNVLSVSLAKMHEDLKSHFDEIKIK